MGNVISVMEKLGTTIFAKQLTEAELATMLKEQGVVLDNGISLISAVEQAVEARSNVVCGIFPAEEPGKEQPDDNDDDEKKEPESRLIVNG